MIVASAIYHKDIIFTGFRHNDIIHYLVKLGYKPPIPNYEQGFVTYAWDFLCRDSILAAPIVLDLALFMDLAKRTKLKGIQEWLSFYFKSPICAPNLYPEHDLFIQQTKLKNTLRAFIGEEQITHLGLDYYLE